MKEKVYKIVVSKRKNEQAKERTSERKKDVNKQGGKE